MDKNTPLQYSCLENFMDQEAWRATVHEATKSGTRLSESHTHRGELLESKHFNWIILQYFKLSLQTKAENFFLTLKS